MPSNKLKKAVKKNIKSAAKKTAKAAPKKHSKAAAKKPIKVVEKSTTKEKVKSSKKDKSLDIKETKGKPIDAILKVGKKNKKSKESKKGKKSKSKDSEDGEIEFEGDIEDIEIDGDELIDLEDAEGVSSIDDDLDEDEIPEKRGRGRRKKVEPKPSNSNYNIRTKPLNLLISNIQIKKKQKMDPKPFVNTKDNRKQYSEKELKEFKKIILNKLKEAEDDYNLLKLTLSNSDNHGIDDTSPSFKLLEDGSDILSKEESAMMAVRQSKYILNLKNALLRIENKTYGICRITGKLIPTERLRSVPHATLSIDAKLSQ